MKLRNLRTTIYCFYVKIIMEMFAIIENNEIIDYAIIIIIMIFIVIMMIMITIIIKTIIIIIVMIIIVIMLTEIRIIMINSKLVIFCGSLFKCTDFQITVTSVCH